MIWGNFGALMQNDQFGYSKQSQADWAFPMQILSFVAVTPFAGWYSDVRITIRWWLRILLVLVSVASFMWMLWVVKHYSPADIRLPPGFLILSWVSVLAAVSAVALYVAMVETMLDIVGREHARAWVSLLTVIKSILAVAVLYYYIQSAPGQVLPIMTWTVFSVFTGVIGGMMATMVGPMIYDYLPRSQIGTFNAGFGILNSLLTLAAVNLGAWWITFFSTHIHKPDHTDYDYSSMYILQLFVLIPAIAAKVYFIRLILQGRMKRWGVIEVENPELANKEENVAPMPRA